MTQLITHKTCWRKLAYFFLASIVLTSCLDTHDREISYSGYIEGKYHQISPIQAGKLTKIWVREGTEIKVDDKLFSLDQQQQNLELQQAKAATQAAQALLADSLKGARSQTLSMIEAQISAQTAELTYAKSELERWKELATQAYGSKSNLEQAQDRYQSAEAKLTELQNKLLEAKLGARPDQVLALEAKLKQAQSQQELAEWKLSQQTIQSTVEGSVEKIYYRVGEYVIAGQPVLSILPTDQIYVRFFVPQSQLSQFKLNQKVYVKIDQVYKEFPAIINFIAQHAEFTPPVIYSRDVRDKLVFMLEAQITAPAGLRVGQPVEVFVE